MRAVNERERIARKAGWAVHQAGDYRKVAKAIDKHPSQPSRWINGAQFGVPYRTFEFVRALAKSPDLDVQPFIAALQAEAMSAGFENRSTAELVKLWHALRDRVPVEDADEVRASRGPCRQKYREALLREAASQVQLAAVDEELERRGVDPADYRADGWLIKQ